VTSTSLTFDESTDQVPATVEPAPRRVPEPGWGRVPRWAAELLTYLAVTVTSTLATVWSLQLWRADLRVPFLYWGDALATSAHVKTTLATGWYEHQPLLGVPAGQTFHDFPTADNLHLVAVRLLGLVTDDWPTVLNLYFLLGFPLAAVAAVYFLRQIGAGRTGSVVVGTLFAVAPYHFLRAEGHLWLASYYVVPLALLVVYRVLRGEPLWGPAEGSGERRWTRAAVTALACVTVATASTYYAVFTVALLAAASVVALAQHRRVRAFGGAVAATALTVAVTFLNMLPDTLWSQQHGPDLGALVRNGAEAELYSLKLTALLLPVSNHVLGPLAALRQHYDNDYPLISERPMLGTAGAIGLVVLLTVVLVQLARSSARSGDGSARWRTLTALGALCVVALLLSTTGGLSSIVSLVTPDLRGWNRMSIVIMLLALAAVATVMDMAAGWLRARTSALVTGVALGVVGAVLVVAGTVDQVGRGAAPAYETTAAAFASDAQWVGEVEQELGADAWVFQLPYLAFPEAQGLNGVLDTDQLRPFLHSDTLGWSGGGIKGRAASDWGSLVAALPVEEAAPQMVAAGFSGALVDRVAYGPDADAVQAAWTALAGDPIVTSTDGRHLVFDLRPVREQLDAQYTADSVAAAGDAVTHPTMIYPGADAVVTTAPADTDDDTDAETDEGEGDGERDLWTGAGGTLTTIVDNASSDPATVVVELSVLPSSGPLTLSAPWGTRTAEPGDRVRWSVDVPSGQSTLTLSSPGGASVQVTAPRIVPRTAPLDLLVPS